MTSLGDVPNLIRNKMSFSSCHYTILYRDFSRQKSQYSGYFGPFSDEIKLILILWLGPSPNPQASGKIIEAALYPPQGDPHGLKKNHQEKIRKFEFG